MKLKKGDFIEINFIGKIKDSNQIFDLTDEKTAKENNIYNPKIKYGSIIICLGEKHVVSGLDQELIGKEIGKEYKIELKPEQAFGKKNPKLFQLINTAKFKEQNLKPVPGLQVSVDNMLGIIKSVSGGRTLVDFNHPLAGREVIYEIKILRKIDNDREKLKGLLKLILGKDVNVKIKDGKATIDEKVPDQLEKVLEEKIKALIPGIKQLSFKLTNEK